MNCVIFDGELQLDPDFTFVRVTCGRKGSEEMPPSDIYKHFHSYVSITRAVRVKMDLYNESIRLGKKFDNDPDVPPFEAPWSVMIIGLDSVSRLNLHRTMPKTVEYLGKSGWYGLEGFNKVGDNTFPNLAAAVMAGSTEEQLRKTCAPKSDTPMDWCPWIWGKFANQGYITAYGEDNTRSDTFYTQAGGFRHPPTDYFLRTLLKAADSSTRYDWFKKFIQYYDCLGKLHESEYIFDFSLEFAETLKFYPTFALFWLNSFSHDKLYGPKPMDEYFQSYLQNLTAVINDTIVVLMSDHGMNHGFYRETEMGFIESNLPFVYFWLPESFKRSNPTAVENLIENKHKLTSHFDLHLTLLYLLGDVSPAPGCPKCTSLFQAVPSNRTCDDAGIPLRYCACSHYTNEPNTSNQHFADFLIKEVNAIVKPLQNYTLQDFRCANFSLNKIISIKRLVSKDTQNLPPLNATEILLVTVETKPKALFEALISKNDSMHVIDNIIRLDSYDKRSSCLNNDQRKYCVCESTIDVMKMIIDDEKAIDAKFNLSAKSPIPVSSIFGQN